MAPIGTVGRERYSGDNTMAAIPCGRSPPVKAVKGWRFEAADSESTTVVEMKSKIDRNITFSLLHLRHTLALT
jgi:hypothetical protein